MKSELARLTGQQPAEEYDPEFQPSIDSVEETPPPRPSQVRSPQSTGQAATPDEEPSLSLVEEAAASPDPTVRALAELVEAEGELVEIGKRSLEGLTPRDVASLQRLAKHPDSLISQDARQLLKSRGQAQPDAEDTGVVPLASSDTGQP